VLDSVCTHIAQHRTFATGAYDACPIVKTCLCESNERLARQVPNGLMRVGPTEHEEAHVGIGKHIEDETLDAQVFRLERAHQGDGERIRTDNRRSEGRIRQGADGSRSPITEHGVCSGEWRPAAALFHGFCGAYFEVQWSPCGLCSQSIHGERRVTDGAPEAVVAHRRKVLTCCFKHRAELGGALSVGEGTVKSLQ
jgi:hypothetical protein